MERSPDIVFLAAEWQPRALIRAQLIEEGFEVVATNTWPMARRHLRAGMKPRLVVIDLKGLPNPNGLVDDLRVLMKPSRVLVLTAVGTIAPAAVRAMEFHVLSRPITIENVVRAAAKLLQSADQRATNTARP